MNGNNVLFYKRKRSQVLRTLTGYSDDKPDSVPIESGPVNVYNNCRNCSALTFFEILLSLNAFSRDSIGKTPVEPRK